MSPLFVAGILSIAACFTLAVLLFIQFFKKRNAEDKIPLVPFFQILVTIITGVFGFTITILEIQDNYTFTEMRANNGVVYGRVEGFEQGASPTNFGVLVFSMADGQWQSSSDFTVLSSTGAFSVQTRNPAIADKLDYCVFLISTDDQKAAAAGDYGTANELSLRMCELSSAAPTSAPGLSEPPRPTATPVIAAARFNPETAQVQGTITGIKNPGDYRVILFIFDRQWYVKPSFSAGAGKELSELAAEDDQTATFRIPVYPGGFTPDVPPFTQFTVFLVPGDFAGLANAGDYKGDENACIGTPFTVELPAENNTSVP